MLYEIEETMVSVIYDADTEKYQKMAVVPQRGNKLYGQCQEDEEITKNYLENKCCTK